MTDEPTVLRPADYRRMRWQNGGGWTTELARRPAEGATFDWRISLAEVDADCDFSPFPGVDRSILVLAGAGMALHVGDDPPVTLAADGPALAFAGDRPTRCRLLAGPTRDFNVMTRRGALTHALTRHALTAPLTLDRGDAWFVYVVDGAPGLGARRLAAGDSALLEAVPGDSSVLTGAGALLLVRLRAG